MERKRSEPTELPELFIREWMAAKGIKGKDLADPMGTTEATVSRLLNGKRGMSLEWLYAFAKALGLSVADLFIAPGRKPPITGDTEILATLARIDGLRESDIDLVYGVIKNALGARRAAPEPSVSHDPQRHANHRHESEPSR